LVSSVRLYDVVCFPEPPRMKKKKKKKERNYRLSICPPCNITSFEVIREWHCTITDCLWHYPHKMLSRRPANSDYRHKRISQNCQSTSKIRTLCISFSNIAGVISPTCTLIRLSAPTRLYSSIFRRVAVSNRAPNGCRSRALNSRTRICFSAGDRVDGGRSDATSGAERLPSPIRDMSRAVRVRWGVDAILDKPGNDGNWPSTDNLSSVFSSAIVSCILPTGCLSRRKSIQGWTRHREPSWERSSCVSISTVPSAFVRARKTRSDSFRETDNCPSLNARHGSFIRRPKNDGTGSSSTW